MPDTVVHRIVEPRATGRAATQIAGVAEIDDLFDARFKRPMERVTERATLHRGLDRRRDVSGAGTPPDPPAREMTDRSARSWVLGDAAYGGINEPADGSWRGRP